MPAQQFGLMHLASSRVCCLTFQSDVDELEHLFTACKPVVFSVEVGFEWLCNALTVLEGQLYIWFPRCSLKQP